MIHITLCRGELVILVVFTVQSVVNYRAVQHDFKMVQ